MSEFYFQTMQSEIDIVFPTYSLKFNSYQRCSDTGLISKLFFQKFTQRNNYNALQQFNLCDKLFAQILILDASCQTELQNLFCSNMLLQNSAEGTVVAECVGEDCNFVYLIFDVSKNYLNCNGFFQNSILSIFKFAFHELWNMPANAVGYVKSLQLTNSLMTKQIQDLSNTCTYYQQNITQLENSIVNKERQLGKFIKIAQQKKNDLVKKVQNLRKNSAKHDTPSFDCVLCYSYPKNIVFLPCGHIVACKSCTVECLNIDLGKFINQRRNPRDCPVCNQSIKEAREVFI